MKKNVDIILTNALVLTMDEEFNQYPAGAIAVQENNIVAVGPADEITKEFEANEESESNEFTDNNNEFESNNSDSFENSDDNFSDMAGLDENPGFGGDDSDSTKMITGFAKFVIFNFLCILFSVKRNPCD